MPNFIVQLISRLNSYFLPPCSGCSLHTCQLSLIPSYSYQAHKTNFHYFVVLLGLWCVKVISSYIVQLFLFSLNASIKFHVCRNFYGPGGPYAMFTGKECSRALALLSFKPADINGNLEGLGEEELTILEDWEFKFKEKYVKVGQLVPERSTQPIEQGEQIQDELNLDEGKQEQK